MTLSDENYNTRVITTTIEGDSTTRKGREEDYTKVMETQSRTVTKEELVELASLVRKGLAPYDTIFYEVYSVTLQNGRKIAGDGLDELFLEDEMHDVPRELHVWIAGVNNGRLNRLEIYFTSSSVLLKVWGHDKTWVEEEYLRIAAWISGLRVLGSEPTRLPRSQN